MRNSNWSWIDTWDYKSKIKKSLDKLTVAQKIDAINNIVKNLPIERQRNICSDCRIEKVSDFENYGFLEDTGICSLCSVTKEVINYSVVEIIKVSEVDSETFYRQGGNRIYPIYLYSNQNNNSH